MNLTMKKNLKSLILLIMPILSYNLNLLIHRVFIMVLKKTILSYSDIYKSLKIKLSHEQDYGKGRTSEELNRKHYYISFLLWRR